MYMFLHMCIHATSLVPRLLANCVWEGKREPGLHCMHMRELSQPTSVKWKYAAVYETKGDITIIKDPLLS